MRGLALALGVGGAVSTGMAASPSWSQEPASSGHAARQEASKDDSQSETRRLLGALSVYSDQARSQRLGGAVGGILGGGALIGSGVLLRSEWDSHKLSNAAFIVGGLGVLGGLVSLLPIKSPYDELRDEYDRVRVLGPHAGAAAGPPKEAIQQTEGQGGVSSDRESQAVRHVVERWREKAAQERQSRPIGGWVGIGLGTVIAGLGAFMLASDTITDDPKARPYFGTILLAAGAGAVAGGVTTILTPGSLETSYRAVYGDISSPRIQAGIAPAPGGGIVGLSGVF